LPDEVRGLREGGVESAIEPLRQDARKTVVDEHVEIEMTAFGGSADFFRANI
jgi:hypothetical protein